MTREKKKKEEATVESVASPLPAATGHRRSPVLADQKTQQPHSWSRGPRNAGAYPESTAENPACAVTPAWPPV